MIFSSFFRKLIFLLFLFCSFGVWAKTSIPKLIQEVYSQFENGQYESVIETLDKIEKRIKSDSKKANEIRGLVYYWKAMSHSRLNNFEESEQFFIKALDAKYFTQDIYYEYGQVLYVSLKYKRARVAFKKSVKRKYKVGVSLYYIAYISQELKDYKRAVTFYNLIEKLPEEEKKDVIQAARMQIGDIYLIQVERQRDPFKGVESYVIPQYEKALQYNEESKLAGEIKSKIENLQRKYELILFRMRNGRPTARPPYYIRANILYGTNDNVTSTTEDDKSSLETDDYASTYYQVGFFSRYSFYPSSSFSYAPEFSTQMTKYSSSSSSILPFNSYFIKGALKMNYEHLYRKLPATFFMDIDYTYNADDADADEEFAASDNTYGLTLSEEVQFWDNNPSTFRFRYENVAAEEDTDLRSVMSLSYEQIVLLSKTTLFFYNNYAITTYSEAETSNTTALTTRLDAIFPTFYKLFNPTLYASYVSTDYPDYTEDRATQLTTLGINLNRPLGKKFYLTMDMSQGSQTGDLDSDIYNQQVITFNIDYIY